MAHNISKPVQNFFAQHLVTERNLSAHTVLAYRDTMKLFLAFASAHYRKSCMDLTLEDLSAKVVRKFLAHLDRARHNTVRTQNVRLAALHAFFRYLAASDPRFLAMAQSVLGVPFKRQAHPVEEYLEREEVACLFRHIDPHKTRARRDEAILRLLYNSGARAQEMVDLDVHHVRFSRPFLVRIYGKGNKERTCPLWPETIGAIKAYLGERGVRLSDRVPLFENARGERLTRFGLGDIVRHCVAAAAKSAPALLTRKISPHTFRHTTAMHLLQSGVDLNMIRSWMGHSSIETTHRYVELDLEMKRKTLQSCEKVLPKSGKHGPSWQRNPGILAWLSRL